MNFDSRIAAYEIKSEMLILHLDLVTGCKANKITC
jgi:hypothetical protein